MKCQPPPKISSQEDSVEANSSRPSSRTKRKSASQPESVKRLERSRSSLRFPAEDPCDSVKMTQIFLEDEPWHSCYAKGCQEKFSRYDLLIEHASKTHPKLKPAKYPCALKSCKFTCESPRDWITHMAEEHPQFGCSSHHQRPRVDRIYSPKEFVVNKATTSPIPYSDHRPVQDNMEELRAYYKLWPTPNTNFNALGDWWESVKTRTKMLACRSTGYSHCSSEKKTAHRAPNSLFNFKLPWHYPLIT
ncbi:hypothetical protein BSL78_27102 [Apostichopus japonicus]|uniref:C2H2-type domain-containing protein n=1 Tax=Stichopus japonicus TaxID=307972 RepID=A0A2G8JK08_STIJA|nr:hypothetical protein BSL78_27102 [Apostichopus japonicus]